MDVEMIRLARQARTGIPVRDDLWLDDVLDRVGPCGSFLGERSTRQNARRGEWRLSDLGVQGSWDAWRAAGSPTTVAAARERVEQLLADAGLAAVQRRPGAPGAAAAPLDSRRRAAAPPSCRVSRRARRRRGP